jgi:hypothetical protein
MLHLHREIVPDAFEQLFIISSRGELDFKFGLFFFIHPQIKTETVIDKNLSDER